MTRSAQWGHWGITFVQWEGDRRPYVPQIMGTVYFGVGSQGPIDAGPARQRYQELVRAWMSDAVLPAGIDTKFVTTSQTDY